MRPHAAHSFFAAAVFAALPIAADGQDRYGGSGSSAIDYSKLFDQTAPRTGGSSYRNSGNASAAAATRNERSAPAGGNKNTLRGASPQRQASQPAAQRAPGATALPPEPRAPAPRSRPSSAYGTPPSGTPATSSPLSRRLSSDGYRPLRDLPASGLSDANVMRLGRDAGLRERQTRDLLVELTRRPDSSQLRGTPRSLSSVVASGATRDEQTRLVDAYWALFSASADYYLGLYEADELRTLAMTVPTYSATIEEAQAALRTRIDTSLKAARAAQYRLGQMLGDGSMPLTTDMPFTGPYATRVSQVFPGGAPAEARLLDELIPLRLADLYKSAEAVRRANQWRQTVANNRKSGSDGTGLVQALQLLALNRRAFVQLARDYNLQINRYARLAAPGQVDTGLLVGMLVRTPGGGRFGSPTIAAEGPYGAGGRDFR